MDRWFEKPVRVLQFNFEDEEGAYVPVIRGEDVVALAKRIHANVVVVFARDAWGRAFYGSKLAPKHSKLGGRDFLRELVESARREGIRIVAMIAHTTNPYLYSKHPDWAQVGVDGRVITMDTDPKLVKRPKPHWPLMCLNGPFLDHARAEAEEILGYGVDGVFLDSLRYQPDHKYACFCRRCEEKFREEHGYDLPRVEDWNWEFYRRAFLWRYEVNVRAIRRIREAVPSGVPLVYNSHPGGWGGRFNMVVEMARDYIDVVYAECSEADFQPPGFIAEMVRLSKAMNGGKPVWASRNTFHTVLTTASTSPVAIRQGLREAVIAGGSPLALIFSSAFVQDRRSEGAVAAVYSEIERLEEYLDGAEPVRYAAIAFSNRSVCFFGRKNPEVVIDEARGFYYSLLAVHVPIAYVSDRDLSEGRLGGFRVIVLPNTACMSEEASRAVAAHVKSGGGLVATYLASKMDELGNEREEFALWEALGVRYRGLLKAPWSYIEVEEYHEVTRGLPRGGPVLWGDFDKDFVDRRVPPMIGWHALVELEGAKSLARVVLPAAEYGNEYNNGRSPPVAGAPVEAPAIAVREAPGRVVYFSGQLGRLAWSVGLRDYTALAVDAVLWAGGRPPVWGSPPESYELSAFSQGDRLVVHLLNYAYNQRILAAGLASMSDKPKFGSEKPIHPAREVVPIGGIEIYLDASSFGAERPARAYSALTGMRFEVAGEKSVYRVKIPRLEEYEVVVVEWS